MSEHLIARVQALVDALNTTDLVKLRISDEDGGSLELRRAHSPRPRTAAEHAAAAAEVEERPQSYDVISADLVGIAHLSKPAHLPGAAIEGDRELAYVEALGIRNPVRSRGSGRLVAVLFDDGEPVEYGQPLFEIDR